MRGKAKSPFRGSSFFPLSSAGHSGFTLQMSRRNIKPTTFHDDSRSSDAGSVVAAPSRPKPRTFKDPAKDGAPLRDHNKIDLQVNGIPTSNAKLPPIGPDGEIQVYSHLVPICTQF